VREVPRSLQIRENSKGELRVDVRSTRRLGR